MKSLVRRISALEHQQEQHREPQPAGPIETLEELLAVYRRLVRRRHDPPAKQDTGGANDYMRFLQALESGRFPSLISLVEQELVRLGYPPDFRE